MPQTVQVTINYWINHVGYKLQPAQVLVLFDWFGPMNYGVQ